MAVYVNDIKIVNGEKIIKYHIDTEADIDNLPTERVGNSSTAFVISSGKVAFKTNDGWRIPPWMS